MSASEELIIAAPSNTSNCRSDSGPKSLRTGDFQFLWSAIRFPILPLLKHCISPIDSVLLWQRDNFLVGSSTPGFTLEVLLLP